MMVEGLSAKERAGIPALFLIGGFSYSVGILRVTWGDYQNLRILPRLSKVLGT